jgi:hypothetical protein
MQCEHYECRCARARELMIIADRTGNARYIHEAAHLGIVECRMKEWERSRLAFPHRPNAAPKTGREVVSNPGNPAPEGDRR